MTLGDVKENVRDTRTEEQRMLSRDKDNALKKFKRQNRKYY
jgi:hypothetical protein